MREAYELGRAGENGEPLREALHFARDPPHAARARQNLRGAARCLLDLANETLAGDPQAGEHARGMAIHMAEQLAAVGALLGPIP